MSQGLWTFIGLVFCAVFLLSQGTVVPVVGGSRRARKKLEARLRDISATSQHVETASLLRRKYLDELSPTERSLESLPGMEWLARMIDQAGRQTRAYHLILLSLVAAVVVCVIGYILSQLWQVALAAFVAGLVAPIMNVLAARASRLNKLEEQMPEAMDVIKRALKAGHPFNQSLKLVAEDMDQPIAREFDLTFADLSYGSDPRMALLGLLQRVPSMSVMALVTAVLVQRETGGNLAETLERISGVVRGRFRFQRRLKTLTAESRMSAWVLAMMPIVLFAAMWIMHPEYVARLTNHPQGSTFIGAAAGLGLAGILWMRRLIRIEV
jgi:tight adherence protein B